MARQLPGVATSRTCRLLFLRHLDGAACPKSFWRCEKTSGIDHLTHYFDSSALVKLVTEEAESGSLRAWLAEEHRLGVSSNLTITEVLRAVRRVQAERTAEARRVVTQLTLVDVTPEICEWAAMLRPLRLRSLDAIHLATALDLAGDLEGLVTYDERLARAASEHGIPTLAPR